MNKIFSALFFFIVSGWPSLAEEFDFQKNPIRQEAFWPEFRNQKMNTKFRTAPPEVIDFLIQGNIKNGWSERPTASLISFWGGFQSHQLLEHLDFDLIRRNPKPFIGYSDTTALQIAIHTMTGLVSFSGPAVVTFSKPELPSFTLELFKNNWQC